MEENKLWYLAILDRGAVIVAGCVEECESCFFLANADVLHLSETFGAIPAVRALQVDEINGLIDHDTYV